jgi:hypothetical protein
MKRKPRPAALLQSPNYAGKEWTPANRHRQRACYAEASVCGLRVSFWRFLDDRAFSHASIKILDASNDDVVRMGLGKRVRTQCGIMPHGLAEGDTFRITNSHEAIDRDLRFQAAMEQVINGGPCPGFRLPSPHDRQA